MSRSIPLTPLLAWVALAHCAAPLRAQQDAAPRFVVQGIDAPYPPAVLQRLGEGWSLELGTARETISAHDWIGLQQEGQPRPAPLTENLVLLGTGDRLPIKPGQPLWLD